MQIKSAIFSYGASLVVKMIETMSAVNGQFMLLLHLNLQYHSVIAIILI